MFLHMSVILSIGGRGFSRQGEPPPSWERRAPPGTRQTPLAGRTPPGPGRPPPAGRTPPDQAEPPPMTRQTPSPGSRLQNTVYEQPVRILLECILVKNKVLNLKSNLCSNRSMQIDISKPETIVGHFSFVKIEI